MNDNTVYEMNSRRCSPCTSNRLACRRLFVLRSQRSFALMTVMTRMTLKRTTVSTFGMHRSRRQRSKWWRWKRKTWSCLTIIPWWMNERWCCSVGSEREESTREEASWGCLCWLSVSSVVCGGGPDAVSACSRADSRHDVPLRNPVGNVSLRYYSTLYTR